MWKASFFGFRKKPYIYIQPVPMKLFTNNGNDRKFRRIQVILYLYLSLTLTIPMAAQPSNWEVHQYTTADGLSSNYVNCVYRDSRGFIWLGTGSGLNRFDA
jgi:hypothetical protein